MTLTITSHPALETVAMLLTAHGLPAQDIEPPMLAHFFEADEAGEPRGVVGLQLAGDVALLRSLAVVHQARGQGLGAALVRHAEAHARRQGVRTLFLLTTDAAAFFARQGFEAVPRASAPGGIAATAQFSSICCSSATLMRKALGG